jgi:hypothetical protein
VPYYFSRKKEELVMARGYGEIRAWGRMLIPHFAAQGLGPNAIMREVRKALGGRGWKRQVMLDDIRKVTGFMKLEPIVRKIPDWKRPWKSAMVETDLRRPRKYRIFADAEWMDLRSGEIEKKMVSWYTDRSGTMRDWKNGFIEWVEREKYKPDFALVSLTIRCIEHNRGFTY